MSSDEIDWVHGPHPETRLEYELKEKLTAYRVAIILLIIVLTVVGSLAWHYRNAPEPTSCLPVGDGRHVLCDTPGSSQ